MVTKKQQRINSEITNSEVRLIGMDGQLVGIVQTVEALKIAAENELDLVEISPNASPPVCKIISYGKFKYQESKKAHEAKLKQKIVQIKEVKFRLGTEEADYNVKLKGLIRFLETGNKTRITLRFRGRELAYQEAGLRVLEKLKSDLSSYGQIEQFPKMEGRQMVMILSPKRK